MKEEKKQHTVIKVLNPFTVYLPAYHSGILRKMSDRTRIPIARLIAAAVDNCILDESKLSLDVREPETDYEEFKYSNEANKILTFLKTLDKGMGLDYLLLVREEIGVTDKDAFKEGFRELVRQEMIEGYAPFKTSFGRVRILPDNYKMWRAVDLGFNDTKKKRNNKSDRYEMYLRLQKEFKNE